MGDRLRFVEKCPWEKLDGKDWRELLIKQPQFADKCDWSKLGLKDWGLLLFLQPQFRGKCPFLHDDRGKDKAYEQGSLWD